jgi:choline dehydrogenase
MLLSSAACGAFTSASRHGRAPHVLAARAVLGGSSTINGCCGCAARPRNTIRARRRRPGWGRGDAAFLKRCEGYAKAIRRCVAARGQSTLCSSTRRAGCRVPRAARGDIPATADYNWRSLRGCRDSADQHLARPTSWRPARPTSIRRAAERPWRCTGARPSHQGRERAPLAWNTARVASAASRAPPGGDRRGRRGAERICWALGIGDLERLASFGIASVVHLPGVGENCRDHLHTRISYESRVPDHLERHLATRCARRGWACATCCGDGPMAAC